MSSLLRFQKQIQSANAFGFSWTHYTQILQQIQSECDEVKHDIERGASRETLQQELGDLLHVTLSLILFLEFDVEETLTKTLDKFEGRFEKLKEIAKEQGLETLHDQSLPDLRALWEKAKESA